MHNINAMPSFIMLGNQRDFGHTIQFDLTAWDDLNADDWKITYMRPGERATYPVSDGDVSVADNILTWTISEAVTAINGAGSVVIEAYRGGEMLKHSARVMTLIGEGHEPAGEAPEPVADWIDDANVKIGELDESLESANAAEGLREIAEEARETAEGLREGAETARETAEGLREGAEIERETAEGLRDSAETARKEAEALRVAAEAARMGFKPMGAYNPANENKYGEWYTHEGGSYGYIWPEPSTGVPLTDTSHWQQIAAKGDQGNQGIQGVKGDTGNGIVSVNRTSGDGTPGTTDTYTIAFDDDSTTTFQVYNGADGDISNIKVDGATKTKAAGVVDLTSDFARYALWRKTASGNPVSVCPVPESPLYPKVSGTFTQEGTGDPSPENIRPITPWLESGGTVKVKRTGKNLYDISSYPLIQGSWVNGGDGANGSSLSLARTNFIPVSNIAGKVVTLNKRPGGTHPGFAFYDSSSAYISGFSNSPGTAGTPWTITIPPDAVYMRFTTVADATDIQVEFGSVSTPYEPYSGAEYDLYTADQDLYGLPGAPVVVDAEAGTVTVQDGVVVLDGSTTIANLNTTDSDNTVRFHAYLETHSVVKGIGNVGGVSDKLKYNYQLPNVTPYGFYTGTNSDWGGTRATICLPRSVLSSVDLAGCSEWLETNKPTIIFRRYTSITIPITPPSIHALPQLDRVTPRQNVLTASTGNVELTYAKSPIQESNDIATAIAAL